MVLKSINCLLADGTTCKIDIGFYPIFKKHNWYRDSNGYIITNEPINGKQQTLYLHHLVMDFKYDPLIDLMVDHKYGDKSDNRKKKLRIVSRSTNGLNNTGYENNTGFERIHCRHDDDNKSYYYQVSYININKHPDKKYFHYIPGENEEDVFLKAYEFYEYTLTLPHYVEARPNPDDESSSGENVHEPNYENSVNLERLRPNNTSQYENINIPKGQNYWLVRYYDSEGNRRQQRFKFKPHPKAYDTKDEALIKALFFQKQYDKYHPNNKKNPVNKTNGNINVNVNVKTKKKKKSIPKSKRTIKNIEDDDATTSPENDDTESSNDEFRFDNDKFNMKNIPEKSKLDQLIDDNTPKSLLDLLLEKNTPKSNFDFDILHDENTPKKSMLDILIEENTPYLFENGNETNSCEESISIESIFDRMDIDMKKNFHESGSESDTITMSDEEINEWKLIGNPNYNNHTFILK